MRRRGGEEKASIPITQNTGVIVGALNLNENIHDSKTLPPVLEQYERLHNKKPVEVYADRGYRGPKQVNSVAIKVPLLNKNITKGQRKKHSSSCSHRTGNQPFKI